MVALNFSTQGVAPNAALEAIPSGVYPVVITSTQEKPTRAGDGAYIEFEMTIQAPSEFAGRKVFDRLNIRNKNQQAVDIAYGTLSAICHVVNRHNIQQTEQLHNLPFQAVVAKVARDDRPGEFSNEVKGYKDAQGNDPGKSGQGAAPGAAPGWAGQGAPGGVPNGQAPQQYAPAPGAPPQGYPQQAPQQQYAPQGQPQQYAPPQGQAPQQQYQPGAAQQPHVGQEHAVNPPQQPQQPQQPPAWTGPNGGQPQQAPQQAAPAPQAPQQQAPQQGGQPGFTPQAAPPWAGGGQAAAPQG